MALVRLEARPHEHAPGPLPPGGVRSAADILVMSAIVAAGLGFALMVRGRHLHAVPAVARGLVASLVLFLICGDAVARLLVPPDWGLFARLFALPLGAAVSGLALTVLGLVHVPLHVSLGLTIAAGVLASLLVRRRTHRSAAPPGDRRRLALWLAALLVLLCLALIPAWQTGQSTIYGQNPDAQQVAGIAVLFQHVAPTDTDVALPVDTVPPSWRFRYPIFYPLAAASNLSHFDPIRVFLPMSALLLVVGALGFGAFAVLCLGAPAAAGPAIAAVVGFSVTNLHLVWHPYWNQLWGFAMLPYALLFGWQALTRPDARVAVLFGLLLITVGLAYPLALPYPLVVVAALAIAYWRRPRLPALVRSHTWVAAAIAVIVLAPAAAGAALKLGQGLGQLLSPHSALWGGDIRQFRPVGNFVGTGGGIVPALAVAALAGLALWWLPRRAGRALGIILLALCLLDLRFRLASSGAYMDFKHLTFVGAVILTLAATAVARLVSSRSARTTAAGLALALAWTAAALAADRDEGLRIQQQVPPTMFQIRRWARELPPGASVRLDIPPSGVQLWAVYMLGDHPVDSPTPVLGTTYARPRYGLRADYSLGLRLVPGSKRPAAPRLFAANPPVFENDQFVLRRIFWPARDESIPDTASTTLVEP